MQLSATEGMQNPAMDTRAITDVLLMEPAFHWCPAPVLARFLPYVSEKVLKAGDVLKGLGEPAAETFLIVEGAFEVSGKGDEVVTIDDGFLGEEAAIGLDSYAATAKAIKTSRVLAMPSHAIEKLAELNPIRKRLIASFSGRLTPDAGEVPYGKRLFELRPAESSRLILGWVFSVIAPLFIYWQFRDLATLPNVQSLYLLCILSATIMMWVFRVLPDFVPALFAVLCTILIGLAPPEVALSGFSSDSFFMALSILGLSAVITVSGLSFRILLGLLRIGPAHKAWYNFSLFITGTALTPVVPTTNGRIAIVAPFLTDLLSSFHPDDAKAEAARLTGSVVGGVSLLSAVFLSSKSVNFVIFGMLPFQEQLRFQWMYWLFAASVTGLVLMALFFLGSWILFRSSNQPSIPQSLIKQQRRILGKVTAAEWAGILGLGILFVSFFTSALHGIDIPWVALAIIISLLIFGFLGKKDFRERIDWSFLVFLGALIGLVGAMRHVGLDGWLTQQMGWLGIYMESQFNFFILLLAISIFVVRLALPINASVVIFATLLIPTAINIGVNPWVVGFVILLMAEGFIWPYQASYYSMFISLTGPNSRADDSRLALLHLLTFGFKLIAIYASIPFWRYLGIL